MLNKIDKLQNYNYKIILIFHIATKGSIKLKTIMENRPFLLTCSLKGVIPPMFVYCLAIK